MARNFGYLLLGIDIDTPLWRGKFSEKKKWFIGKNTQRATYKY